MRNKNIFYFIDKKEDKMIASKMKILFHRIMSHFVPCAFASLFV
jgi:hypothetical protein